MRSHFMSRLLGAAAILTLLSACSDATGSNGPTDDEVAVDLAVKAGEAITGDLGSLFVAETDGLAFTTAANRVDSPPRGAEGCGPRPGGGRICGGIPEDGTLTLTRSFAFFDADGVGQTNFDPATTASINFQMTLTGTLTRPRGSVTMSRERNMTLSGLAGTETQRIWNGTGSGSENATATGDRGTRTYVGTSKDTTTNVVLKLPRGEFPWPQSGTIMHRVDATASFEGASSGSRTIHHRAVVTFNGTQNVTLEIGTRTCSLDLLARAVTCPTS